MAQARMVVVVVDNGVNFGVGAAAGDQCRLKLHFLNELGVSVGVLENPLVPCCQVSYELEAVYTLYHLPHTRRNSCILSMMGYGKFGSPWWILRTFCMSCPTCQHDHRQLGRLAERQRGTGTATD